MALDELASQACNLALLVFLVILLLSPEQALHVRSFQSSLDENSSTLELVALDELASQACNLALLVFLVILLLSPEQALHVRSLRTLLDAKSYAQKFLRLITAIALPPVADFSTDP